MKQTPICFSGEYFGVILSFKMSGHTDYEKKKKKKKIERIRKYSFKNLSKAIQHLC